jgi:hypothetical protein
MGQSDELRRQASRLLESLRPSDKTKSETVATSVTRLRAPGVDLFGLAQALVRWYEEQNLEAQAFPQADQFIVQCRNKGRLKVAVGLSMSVTVVLRRDHADLVIEISGGKWLDKGVVGGLGIVAVPVQIAPAAWGARVQARMLRGPTVDFLRATLPDHLLSGSAAAPVPPSAVSRTAVSPASMTGSVGRLDVNTATAEQIGALPGIGLILGKKAVQEREARGGFRSVEDFARAVGPTLKPHEFEQLRERLTVSPIRRTDIPTTKSPGRRIED